MRIDLLPAEGTFFKANLHCHTNISDGLMTPQQVKDRYKSQGYSIVAFTDHCVLIPHPELKDEDFLPLNGIEIEVVKKDDIEPIPRRKQNHICYIALEEQNATMPFLSKGCIWGNSVAWKDRIRWDPAHENHIRTYTPQCINEMIRWGKEAGFFVTYNHPTWSQERYEDYMAYEGMDAMEIMNYDSYLNGYGDYNPRVYEEMLLGGKRLYAIAADDNHGLHDTCGAWTMIKAPSLTYRAVTKALEAGHFYASFGPEIHALWLEDGQLHVTCSDAKRIICTTGPYRPRILNAQDAPLQEAQFPILPSDRFFRITVVDHEGRCADTNAYFTDTLF